MLMIPSRRSASDKATSSLRTCSTATGTSVFSRSVSSLICADDSNDRCPRHGACSCARTPSSSHENAGSASSSPSNSSRCDIRCSNEESARRSRTDCSISSSSPTTCVISTRTSTTGVGSAALAASACSDLQRSFHRSRTSSSSAESAAVSESPPLSSTSPNSLSRSGTFRMAARSTRSSSMMVATAKTRNAVCLRCASSRLAQVSNFFPASDHTRAARPLHGTFSFKYRTRSGHSAKTLSISDTSSSRE